MPMGLFWGVDASQNAGAIERNLHTFLLARPDYQIQYSPEILDPIVDVEHI